MDYSHSIIMKHNHNLLLDALTYEVVVVTLLNILTEKAVTAQNINRAYISKSGNEHVRTSQ